MNRSIGPTSTAVWPVLLAGGDGTRLRELTWLAPGKGVPKQFCSLEGPISLLRLALARAQRVAPPERTLAVIAAAHRRWWLPELAELPAANLLVEPSNRGTAIAVLLAAYAAARRDPNATLLLLPADHFVEDEARLGEALVRAVAAARANSEQVYLVGVEADSDDPEFGWILPAAGAAGTARAVERFVEKPDRATAHRLRERSALVNTMLVAAAASVLIELVREHLPELDRALGGDGERRLEIAFERLERRDFSRDLIEHATPRLQVVTAERCGWNDLGTPERVAACLRASHPARAIPRPPMRRAAPLELARALHELRPDRRHAS